MSEYEIIGQDYDQFAVGGMGDTEIIGEQMFDEDYDLIEAVDEMEYSQGLGQPVIGHDYDYEVGARRRRPGRRMVRRTRPSQLAIAEQQMGNLRRLDPNAIAVRKRGLNRRRRFPLGFETTIIPAGGTANIPAAPQNLFRMERLVIPSDIAFDIVIVDLKIGNTSQLVSGGEVPAAIFTEVSIDTNIHFKTAEVGNQVSIIVRNVSAGEVVFKAAAIGSVAL